MISENPHFKLFLLVGTWTPNCHIILEGPSFIYIYIYIYVYLSLSPLRIKQKTVDRGEQLDLAARAGSKPACARRPAKTSTHCQPSSGRGTRRRTLTSRIAFANPRVVEAPGEVL